MANPEHVAFVRKRSPELARLSPADEALGNLPYTNLIGADLAEANLADVNLNYANLNGADLSRAQLRRASLRMATLSGTNLSGANLTDADLTEAKLFSESNLSRADLTDANLIGARLFEANLTGADLTGANLTWARLDKANLRQTHLSRANLSLAILAEANFELAWFERTILAFVDLRRVKGLETADHIAASSIGIETIYLSNGEIPEVFLRGAGVPDTFITFAKSLASKPFDFYSCFISHSSVDQEFAERLHADPQANGVRCWYAPEDLKIGDRFRTRIDEAIRIHDKLLLILSENSVRSAWVETEVETAFERERRESRIVLFPIRIDDTVMQTDAAWAADIRRTRHIGDFRNWKDHGSYQKAFERLLRDLKAGERPLQV
jgi:uncharacterized protein YjbI with pentapeptide repeats